MQEQSKMGKNQKSTDKHSSFGGLIVEDLDLSDIYLAVKLKKEKALQNKFPSSTYRSQKMQFHVRHKPLSLNKEVTIDVVLFVFCLRQSGAHGILS